MRGPLLKDAGAKLDVGLISQAFSFVNAVRGVPPIVCCERPELMRDPRVTVLSLMLIGKEFAIDAGDGGILESSMSGQIL